MRAIRYLTLAIVAASLAWPVLAAPRISSPPSATYTLPPALDTINGISASSGKMIIGQSGSWVGQDGATLRDTMGLGNVENTALSTWAGSTNLITGGSPFRVQKDQNAPTQIISRNDTSGTAGSAQVAASLGNFEQYLTAAAFSPLYTTNGLLQANGTALFSFGAIAGLAVVTLDNYPVYLGTNNTQRVKVDSTGLQATGSISATAGFFVGSDTTNNLIDDASNGAGSTTLYIGNQSITVSSDRRIKSDIHPSKLNASEVVKRLGVVDFTYAKGTTQAASYNGDKRIPGLVAQDVEKVLPMFVNTNGVPAKGPLKPGQEWKIDYPAMVPVLVKALQEQSARADALEARLAALERK